MERARHLVPSFVVAVVLAAAGTASAAPPAAAVSYQPPVHAPVVDAFRPPASPYGPGNRGLEYATSPGDLVRSAAGGEVTFAGVVGHDRFVTVLHADRVRTTYGRLGSAAVAVGDHVGAGEVVGTAGAEGLVWTARIGDAYVDPSVLLAASGVTSVRLVAASGRPGGAGRRAVPGWAAEWALGAAGGRVSMLIDRPGDRPAGTSTRTPHPRP